MNKDSLKINYLLYCDLYYDRFCLKLIFQLSNYNQVIKYGLDNNLSNIISII